MKPTIVAIAVTLAVQTLTAMAMIAPLVLAPVAARDLGPALQSISTWVFGLIAVPSAAASLRLLARR